MSRLSISTAWNEAAAFVKQQAGTLFLIVFVVMVLPGLLLRLVLPHWLPAATVQVTPGSPPDFSAFLAVLPLALAAFIPIFLLSIWGNLAINVLALRRETVAGAAFAHAGRRLLPLLGASVLLIIAVCILVLPIGAVAYSAAKTGHLGWIFLLIFAVWLAAIFIWIRLMLIVPVAAGEEVGPVAIIQRSWALTAGHFWKLLGFFLLLLLVLLVVGLVVGVIGGLLIALVFGAPTPGSTAAILVALLTGLFQAVWIIYLVSMLARIYAQLSGGGATTAEVFE